jgi:hypothetical protein
MKKQAQDQVRCAGGKHCIGCATMVGPWFSLRCQACWGKQAETPRNISFEPPEPPAKPEPSGRCLHCTEITYGPALFCRLCEIHNWDTTFINILTQEQRMVVVREGFCTFCYVIEHGANGVMQVKRKGCSWGNACHARTLSLKRAQ